MNSKPGDISSRVILSEPWAQGKRVDRYTLMGKIAVGGMAEIWLARQAGLKGFEKVVVIKRILDSFSQDETFVEMFLDEARTAAQLNHPNVVQIYDLGEDHGAYYIAMEYLAGETVARIARAGVKQGKPVSFALAARLVGQAADGLGYAHTKAGTDGKPLNIVHRDVSPQNLIVTYDGQVKVLDFGVARAANRVTQTQAGQYKGKIPYMAPEQARGLAFDARSDIFALGIILYELIGRCRLFHFEDPVMGLKALSATEPIASPKTRNPEVPDALAAVTLRALEKDPEKRFQSAKQFQLALEEWLRTQPEQHGSNELAAYMSGLFPERIANQVRMLEAARSGDSAVSKLRTPSSEISMPGTQPTGVTTPTRWAAAVGAFAVALLVGGAVYTRLGAGNVIPVEEVPASLTIESDPPGAALTFDGKGIGNAPSSLAMVTLGTHTLRASALGFDPSERVVRIDRAGEHTNLMITLKSVAQVPIAIAVAVDAGIAAVAPRVARGRLTLSTTPWTQVFEGSRMLGETPLVEFSLPVGKHSLRLENAEKAIKATIVVEIKPGQTTAVKQKL